MARPICQSCSIPMHLDKPGTETDGSPSTEYCSMCYADGTFVEEHTVESMQELVYGVLREKRLPKFMARMAIRKIPKLKRWNQTT